MSEQEKTVCEFTISGDKYIAEDSKAFGNLNHITWPGDSNSLGLQTGEIPGGWNSGPGFRRWRRGTDSTSQLFMHGPYQRLDGIGTLNVRLFCNAPVGRRTSGNAFYVDIFDFTDRKEHLATTFSVADLPSNSDGFIVSSFDRGPEIKSGHKYETRVRCLGGCDLEIYFLRWEIFIL